MVHIFIYWHHLAREVIKVMWPQFSHLFIMLPLGLLVIFPCVDWQQLLCYLAFMTSSNRPSVMAIGLVDPREIVGCSPPQFKARKMSENSR